MYSQIIKTLLLFSIFENLSSQPDLRFNAFDWVAYRQTGSINSVSFSDRYAYIGTFSSFEKIVNTKIASKVNNA